MRQRIVFLDIDGVLNTPAEQQRVGRHDVMDEIPVRQLMRLFDEIEELDIGADPKIVISSSWRLGPPVSWDRTILRGFEEAGWGDPPIIGRTPDLGDDGRGAEIQAWLHEHFGENFAERVVFAIVDDDIHDMLDDQLPFVVKCDTETGLTQSELETLKGILGNFSQEEWIEAIDLVRGLENVWVIDRSAEPEALEQQVEDVIEAVCRSIKEQN